METLTPQRTTIEKKIVIRAPRSRVWRALTTSDQFATWFSAKVAVPFAPGQRVEMVSTHPNCTGDPHFYVIVERMEPEHTFSWRWRPGAADKDDQGESTIVEFRLEEVAEGTLVTVTETGFDRISLAQRAKAFEENTRGWEIQLQSLQQYATRAA